MSWEDPRWKIAAREYHAARGNRPAVVELDREEVQRLRRLLPRSVTVERAYAELNHYAELKRRGCAPAATIEALMYGLSIRNTAALREPEVRERLARLSQDQLYEIADRLQRLDHKVMRKRAPTARPWMADEIKQLLGVRPPDPGALSGGARQPRDTDAETTK